MYLGILTLRVSITLWIEWVHAYNITISRMFTFKRISYKVSFSYRDVTVVIESNDFFFYTFAVEKLDDIC